jgi:DnaK suppressor protein
MNASSVAAARSATVTATPRSTPSTVPGEQQLAALRAMLEQQRRFRLDQLDQLRHSDRPGLLGADDPEIGSSLAAGARAALRDVLDALHRMDDGTYGLCLTCGTRLAIERLEVLPQAPLCMSCQHAAESA